MKNYLQRNYRTYLSIILSLIIVLFIIPIFATPGKLANLLSKIKFPEAKKDEWKTLTKYNQDIKFVETTVEPTQIPSPTNYNNLKLFLTPTPYALHPTPYPLRPTHYNLQFI